MRCGIEFEYLLIDSAGAVPGRIRDFGNLDFAEIDAQLDDRPGLDDPELAVGDLGIKRGYWYLEGDERFFAADASEMESCRRRFRTLAIKGVEIRTPPADGVRGALDRLRVIEARLAERLHEHGLGLAIVAANPLRADYRFSPPLNAWEIELRRRHRACDAAHISNLTYGPDINLSMPDWTAEQALDATRKLNFYAPYLVPFSFCSPFHAGAHWPGFSWRTFHRAPLRPAVKLFLAGDALATLAAHSRLVHPARLPSENGRIEFKAFDAQPAPENLAACCHLLHGVCLANALHGRGEGCDVEVYRRAARLGFHDAVVHSTSGEVLKRATDALSRAGETEGVEALESLAAIHTERRTPADDLLESWRRGGPMYAAGGLYDFFISS
ncbi:MAG: glutamate--cysteine ligase [Candidatus Accumulibacter sp.]|jgi:gamma-glutamyl:cysteine ligase YbdK (ATP-grasp superfamily)|nr:glutamate--cysteine ligase [Accumulibacter sp.]